MPIGIGSFFSTLNWLNFVFDWVMVIVTGLIYFPFFKIYDSQLVKQETERKQTAEV